MKIDFNEIMEYFKKVAEKEGCTENQAGNIAANVWWWFEAKRIGITIEQHSEIKHLDAHATKYKEIARITGVPLHKVYKTVRRG